MTSTTAQKSSAVISVSRRVLIADDHKMMRMGLRSLLEDRKDEFEHGGSRGRLPGDNHGKGTSSRSISSLWI